MADRHPGARRDTRTERLQLAANFYRMATLVLLALVVIESGALIWQAHRTRFARAIRLDGNIVCFVRNARAADEVQAQLIADRKGKTPGAAGLSQKFESLNWPLDPKDKVLTVAEAVAALKPRVTVDVAAAAIRLGKQDLVVVPDKESAQMALDLLKKEFSGGSGKLIRAEFVQQDALRIVEVKRPPEALVTDVSQAVKLLKTPHAEQYVVQPGDSWRKIADAHHKSAKVLRRLNPKLGDALHVKEVVVMAVARPALTVAVIKEEAREAAYTAPPERVMTDTLSQGLTRVTVKAVPGKKNVTETVETRNGKEVSRKMVNETISQPAVPERIMVGTAPPAGTTAPAGSTPGQ